MIRKPTVLILGAGASTPYGFPTGEGLRQSILGKCGNPNGDVRRVIRLAGVDDAQLERFLEALRAMQFPSIDMLLEHRPQYLEVGKLAIAAALIPHEVVTELQPKDRGPNEAPVHWYQQLFVNLFGAGRFDGHNLTVITLNYDRSLEQYLFETLRRDLELSDEDAARKVQEISFIHFHGSLGTPPWMILDGTSPRHAYAPDLEPEGLKLAAKSIQILSEWNAQPHSPLMLNVRLRIGEAKVIGFLGFGYHEPVLQRLAIPDIMATSAHKELYGSGYGLANGRKLSIERDYKGIVIGAHDRNTYQFLNDCGLLFQ